MKRKTVNCKSYGTTMGDKPIMSQLQNVANCEYFYIANTGEEQFPACSYFDGDLAKWLQRMTTSADCENCELQKSLRKCVSNTQKSFIKCEEE